MDAKRRDMGSDEIGQGSDPKPNFKYRSASEHSLEGQSINNRYSGEEKRRGSPIKSPVKGNPLD